MPDTPARSSSAHSDVYASSSSSSASSNSTSSLPIMDSRFQVVFSDTKKLLGRATLTVEEKFNLTSQLEELDDEPITDTYIELLRELNKTIAEAIVNKSYRKSIFYQIAILVLHIDEHVDTLCLAAQLGDMKALRQFRAAYENNTRIKESFTPSIKPLREAVFHGKKEAARFITSCYEYPIMDVFDCVVALFDNDMVDVHQLIMMLNTLGLTEERRRELLNRKFYKTENTIFLLEEKFINRYQQWNMPALEVAKETSDASQTEKSALISTYERILIIQDKGKRYNPYHNADAEFFPLLNILCLRKQQQQWQRTLQQHLLTMPCASKTTKLFAPTSSGLFDPMRDETYKGSSGDLSLRTTFF